MRREKTHFKRGDFSFSPPVSGRMANRLLARMGASHKPLGSNRIPIRKQVEVELPPQLVSQIAAELDFLR
jgi:hypothetical protein